MNRESETIDVLSHNCNNKMASASLKNTRKTYSFEERGLLISLINKHEIIENRKSDPISLYNRKSAWSLIANEYNSMVGPQATRTAVQLKRCWENMKACKRNREEKKFRNGGAKAVCQSTKDESPERNQCWEIASCGQNTSISEAPTSTGIVGLPPNVVFESAESEPFALQSVCTARPEKLSCLQKDTNSCRDLNFGALRQLITDGNKCDAITPYHGPMGDCHERSVKENTESPLTNRSAELFKKSYANSGPNASHVSSPSVMQQDNRKQKSEQRDEELHMLALSEAQMKVDIAMMLKEEARIKLEEAHYRKEEARLRMLLFTYKLERIKED